MVCLFYCNVDVAVEREVEGDLFLHDVGQGLCFKPGTFDGCIRWWGHLNNLFTQNGKNFIGIDAVDWGQ